MLANQITNQSNLFEIGSQSLQFVIDFMYALDAMEEKDLFQLNETFNKQELITFHDLAARAESIAKSVNITTINHSKN